MTQKKNYRLIILKPKSMFATPRGALEASGIPDPADIELSHFQLPEIPIIVSRDGLPTAIACDFLLEKALRSKGVTGDTPRTYGEALSDWLDYLATIHCKCTAVTEERLGLYRLHLLAPAPIGRGKLANTAKLRIVVAMEFHRWGQRTQRLTSPLGAFLAEAGSNKSAFRLPNRPRHTTHSFLPAGDKRLPKILTQEEIVRLFNVAPRPFGLIFRWAIATGMRRMEVCDLRLKQLPSPAALSRLEGGLSMIEVRRKGGSTKSVAVPCRLIEETNWYVATERPNLGDCEDAHVFLGGRGHQISRQNLSKVFRKCADAIGSTATLHHLRHTFAVNVLHSLNHYEGDGQPMNSLKCLQVLLGHASIETTQLYLQALSMSSDAVREALDYLYGGTLESDS
jgi:site-specific recombinase XerD